MIYIQLNIVNIGVVVLMGSVRLVKSVVLSVGKVIIGQALIFSHFHAFVILYSSSQLKNFLGNLWVVHCHRHSFIITSNSHHHHYQLLLQV